MPRPTASRLTASALLVAALGLVPAGCAELRGARLYDRGTRALDAGDTDGAIRDLEDAARLVPRASEVQNHLGLAYAAAGRDTDARAAFLRAEALDCGNEAAHANRRWLERRTADGGPAAPTHEEVEP